MGLIAPRFVAAVDPPSVLLPEVHPVVVAGTPGAVTVLPRNTVWPAGTSVHLRGSIVVPAGGTLGVGAGATIAASPGVRVTVSRDARLDLRGTLLEPIVFRCEDSESPEPGCWDGLVILGHAPVNHGTTTSPSGEREGNGGCLQASDAGLPYGGCSAEDSSGVVQFVRVQYAARGLRLLGVGSRTVFSDVQVHRSLGNGLDVVGGTARLRNLALTTNGQFGLAYSGGWTGRIQYAVIQQDPTGFAGGVLGRNAVSAQANPDATPRSAPLMANLTIVAASAPSNPYEPSVPTALRFDRGAGGTLYNTLLVQASTMVDVDDAATCAQVAENRLRLRGVVAILPQRDADPDVDDIATCPPNDGAEAALLNAAPLVRIDDAQVGLAELLSPLDVVLPDLRPRLGSVTSSTPPVPPPADGFFAPAAFHGALPDAGLARSRIPFYSGWTLGESLPPPGFGAIEGVVLAIGRGGIPVTSVRALPSAVVGAATGLGAYALANVPAGPVEVVADGLPSGCRPASATVHVRAGAVARAPAILVDCTGAGPLGRTVAAGDLHTCALGTDGTAYCWGRNRSGQLGTGDTLQRNLPVAVATSERFVAIAAGRSHTCGLRADGEALCWGDNGLGQLGDGSLSNRRLPVRVQTSRRFVQLSAGGNHTCAVEADGTGSCWGGNGSGQLGDGTIAQRTLPTALTSASRWALLAPGGEHTCGLDTRGTAYCWGENAAGQLGDATATDKVVPTPVDGGQIYAVIAAGEFHSCAITGASSPSCWGFNAEGQLGTGTRTGRLVPTQVAGSPEFTRLALGQQHSCGLEGDGVARCFGNNQSGQMGDGGTADALVPAPVVGELVFDEVDAGTAHTCGRTAAGAIFCWGANLDGQLGDGTTTQRVTPTPVASAVLGATPSAFHFELAYDGTPDASVVTAAEAAAARWTAVIKGDVPDVVTTLPAGSCVGTPLPAGTYAIDDLRVYVRVASIDGPGGVLARAGPCYYRGTTPGVFRPGELPLIGGIELDGADVTRLRTQGRLGDTLLHEVGHVLGLGTFWSIGALLQDPVPSPACDDPAIDVRYVGVTGTGEYPAIGGIGFGSLPVEHVGGCGTANGHWRESSFGDELMTGFLSTDGVPNPVSRVTVGALADLGYVVSYAAADAFTASAPAARAEGGASTLLRLVEGAVPPPIPVGRRR